LSTQFKNACRAGAAVVLAYSLLSLGACSKGTDDTPEKAEAVTLLVSPEDLVTVSNSALASGPSITGSVEAERRADLRAEVSAVVLSVLKENGDPVRRGDLLVRLDPNAIRDSLTAAEASVRAASQAFEQAERQYQRMIKLREAGMIAIQQLEDAETQRNNAQSERAAARTREVTARQQLERTEVRAPFDGIVSDRKVSAGDTASVGKELMQIIDPTSLRFEGRVSADSIGQVAAGQRVSFRIQGFADTDVAGTVTRVNPAANAATRQVEVLVRFDDPKQQPGVTGLYAEGRVETRSAKTLTVPAASVVHEGDNAFAWRVKNGTVQKVKLDLGARDARTGQYVVNGGLAAGDSVLRHPGSSLKDGQPARLAGRQDKTTVTAEQ
jgi:membrane fusion protein (multidrug efflux system)